LVAHFLDNRSQSVDLLLLPVDDVNFATRFRALLVEIAGQSATIWLDLEIA